MGTRLKKSIALISTTLLLSVSLTSCSTALSKEEAADRYLDAACPASLLSDSVVNSLRGTSVENINSATANLRDAIQEEAKILSDDSINWPSEVKPLIEELSTELIPQISVWNRFAKADTFDELNSIEIPSNINDETIQKIRVELDLPADIFEICMAR